MPPTVGAHNRYPSHGLYEEKDSTCLAALLNAGGLNYLEVNNFSGRDSNATLSPLRS